MHTHTTPLLRPAPPRPALAALALIGACLGVFATPTHAEAQTTRWPDLSRPSAAPKPQPNDVAVIVGVEDYAFIEVIPGANRNALAWAAYFSRARGLPNDRIHLLVGREGTRERILDRAQRAAAQATADSTVWFVFIGHGAPPLSPNGAPLLIGSDAQSGAESVRTRSVSHTDLVRALSSGKQAQTVVALDACFSGRTPSGTTLIPGLQPLVPTAPAPKAAPLPDTFVWLTASAPHQLAGPLPGLGVPAFSYLLLGALHGWADSDSDRVVTVHEAHAYTKGALNLLVRGRAQTPTLLARTPQTPLSHARGVQGPDLLDMVAALTKPKPRPAPPKPKRRVKRPPRARKNARVLIPAGAFIMGTDGEPRDAQPARSVWLDAYRIDRHETTVRDYAACVRAGACTPPYQNAKHCPWGKRGPLPGRWNSPVSCVSFVQAEAFCAWRGGRLPTEAEWEKAARGLDGRTYPWGEAPPDCTRAAIRDPKSANTPGCSPGSPLPVGSAPDGASPYGVLNMAGNVMEWTSTWWEKGPLSNPSLRNPKGPPEGTKRVVRGGYWGTEYHMRTFVRGKDPVEVVADFIGFRCAYDP